MPFTLMAWSSPYVGIFFITLLCLSVFYYCNIPMYKFLIVKSLVPTLNHYPPQEPFIIIEFSWILTTSMFEQNLLFSLRYLVCWWNPFKYLKAVVIGLTNGEPYIIPYDDIIDIPNSVSNVLTHWLSTGYLLVNSNAQNDLHGPKVLTNYGGRLLLT